MNKCIARESNFIIPTDSLSSLFGYSSIERIHLIEDNIYYFTISKEFDKVYYYVSESKNSMTCYRFKEETFNKFFQII